MDTIKKIERFVPMLPTTWKRTAFGGLVGGAIFGVIIQFWLGKMGGMGLLYASRSLALGWFTHLFHSIIGALLFMSIVSRKAVNQHLNKPSYRIILGLIYGFFLWAALTAIILPIWFGVVAPWPGGPPQNFTNSQYIGSLIGFLVYGAIVGASTHSKRSQGDEQNPDSDDSEAADLTDTGFIWGEKARRDK